MAKDINIRVGADISDLEKNLNKAQRSLQRSGQKMSRIGNDMIMSLSVPIGIFGASILGAASDFESSMNGMKAVTAGGVEAFDELEKKAKELGATTQFSANEAASAMEMLGRNGLNATQILDGAADASLSLAAATGTDLSNAANVATDAMAQFGLAASDLVGVSDLITGATVNSKFSIDDFQLAMAQAGGVAGAVGVSFEDFATTVSAISPSFASGSDAGTSLKTMLTRLVPASKEAMGQMKQLGIITANGANQFFDASGQMKSMSDISGILQNSFQGLSEEQKISAAQTIFGTDAMRAGLKLAEVGSGTFDQLAASIGGVSAAEVAGIRMEGFKGAVLKLKSAFETLQLAIADSGILDFATSFVTSLTNMTLRMAELDPAVLKVGIGLLAVVAAVGPAIKLFGMFQLLQASMARTLATVVGTFGRLKAVVQSFTSVQAALNVVMAANPVGVVVVAVAALGAAFYALYQNSETFRTGVDTLYNQSLKPFFNFLVEIGGVIFDVFKSVGTSVLSVGKSVWDTFSAMQTAVINFIEKIPIVGKAVGFIKQAFVIAGNLISKIFANLPAVFKGLSAEAKETGEDLKRYFENIALTAQIIAKKVQKALTLDDDARKALQNSIAKLAEQKSALAKEGKAFGEAFKEAYNAEINKMKPPTVASGGGGSSPSAVSGGSVSGGSFEAANTSQIKYQNTVKATTEALKVQTKVFGENATALAAVSMKQVEGSAMTDRMKASVESLTASQRTMKLEQEAMVATMGTFNESLTGVLNQGLTDVATGFGEVVGSMANGTASMADLGGMLLGTLGGLLGQVGKLAIATGVAMAGIKTALQSLNPAVAIIGGVALVALSKVVSSKASSLGGQMGGGAAFAKGGIVDKPTFGVFGEAGTEVIVPKKRLDTYLSDMNNGGGNGNTLTAKIGLRDLVFALEREQGKMNRV